MTCYPCDVDPDRHLLQEGDFADCPVLNGFLQLLRTDKSKVLFM